MNSERPKLTLTGLATARGLAGGPAFIYRGHGEVPVSEYAIAATRADDEVKRLNDAVAVTKRDLEALIAALRERTGRADIRVFECHLMIIEDEFLMNEVVGRIRNGLVNAEAAVRQTMDGARSQFAKMNDPYFRERVRDIDDVERRLLKQLTGFESNPHLELKEPSVVIADDLTPSETVQLPKEFLLGFATNGGSPTSHVALLARALAIPAVTGLVDIVSRVEAGDTVLLDGTNGEVTVNPDAESLARFRLQEKRSREAVAMDGAALPGALKYGGSVKIFANIHPGIPVAALKENRAQGIGLYRSEYLWLNHEREPTEEEQFAAYKSAAQFASTLEGDGSVTIRMLDIGGDKTMKGISSKEANPFLGNRSIRYLLSRREALRMQMRAILRASAFGKVRIMYPMVSCVEELRECARELDVLKKTLASEGIAFDAGIETGAMIEVPSAALNAGALADYADFFSIGTNDLVQYTMAADRGNEAVANLYQPLNPAIIKLMSMTLSAAKEKGIPVAVCGESASDPVVGIFWVAMGVDALSMSATYIPVVSKILSSLTRADLDEYAKVPASLGRDATAAGIFAACREWMSAKLPGFADLLS